MAGYFHGESADISPQLHFFNNLSSVGLVGGFTVSALLPDLTIFYLLCRYIKAGMKTLCVEMSVLLLSISFFFFLHDSLKWISFSNYFGHLWYIFLWMCTTFCLCVPSYGYIIFGIPIFIFEVFYHKINDIFLKHTNIESNQTLVRMKYENLSKTTKKRMNSTYIEGKSR